MPRVRWRFIINGTSDSFFPKEWKLKFNPYPQHGKYEMNRYDLALQSLAEPNMNPEEIRRRLKPYFTDEFMEGVIKRYKPNTVVDCTVTCEW